MRQLVPAITVALIALGCQRPAPPAGPVTYISQERMKASDPLTKQEVLFLIARLEEPESIDDVMALGERLLPAFEEILNDPNTSTKDQVTALGFSAAIKGDRSRFLDNAARRLTSPSGDLRRAAVGFLGNAGTEREASLVAVLLLDKDSTVRLRAAKALAKIGGEREVAVFDLIIHNARRYEEDGKLILTNYDVEDFEKYRDELKARLKK